jgi:RNA polymerase sigma-70 factor (ECF subfamily)
VKSYEALSDSELLRLAKGDDEAFAEFYRRFAEPVYAATLRRVGNAEVAVDVTAEAFAHALRVVGRFRGARAGSGGAWIHAIAESVLNQYWRTQRVERKARERLGIDDDTWNRHDDQDIERRLDALASGGRLERLLDQLPSMQRAVVHMRVVGEAPYSEIARTLGVSPENARQQARRGLSRLREQLEAPEGHPR